MQSTHAGNMGGVRSITQKVLHDMSAQRTVSIHRATSNDANKIMKLHHVFYKSDSTFKDKIENHEKTMWLFSNNADVRKKTVDKRVSTSKTKGVPVARLDCWYDTNKLQNEKERHARRGHFDPKAYIQHTDLCVGARVALRNWNILPQAGLYNGSIGTLVEIVYKDNPIGPNGKKTAISQITL